MSRSKPKIYVRDRVFIPIASIPDVDLFKEKYTRHLFKDSNCLNCEYKVDRPCAVCESCPNYEGVLKLWKAQCINGEHYYGVPIGDKLNIERKAGIDYSDHTIVDRRMRAPIKYKIKWLIELRPHQKKLVREFMQWKYGMLEAPPRTGKTVLLLYIGLMLGQRMVLVAHQHEYLQQFLWHIEGNEEEGIPKCTNLPELELKYGKKLYGFPKTDEDFENMQFMVMTYQSLMETCFIGTTKIVMGDGSKKQMQDISNGDEVRSFNHATGTVENKKVKLLYAGTRKDLLAVTIDGIKYVCTPEHEWWSEDRKCYVKTSELKVGEKLLSRKQ